MSCRKKPETNLVDLATHLYRVRNSLFKKCADKLSSASGKITGSQKFP
jgi:hypothetical protein